MANDQNASHARRPNHHRRRGPERRGHDRSPQGSPPNGTASRDQVDVEQIMRDIRARIATRHGIELTRAQVQELAARRLDAILEPRHIKPELMEQLRRAAGEPVQVPAPARAEPLPELDEAALYHSHRGFLRLMRGWLRPVLKLFINPAPLVEAVNAGRRRAEAAAAREAELYTRQAQWNALHYEILQRLVTDVTRATLEVQSLAMRLEALSARLDFNERRLGETEQILHAGKPPSRPQEVRLAEPAAAQGAATPSAPPETPGEGTRRRRRRRRGRRSGPGAEGGESGAELERGDAEEAELEGEETVEAAEAAEDAGSAVPLEDSAALEPAHSISLVQPVERNPTEASPPDARGADDTGGDSGDPGPGAGRTAEDAGRTGGDTTHSPAAAEPDAVPEPRPEDLAGPAPDKRDERE